MTEQHIVVNDPMEYGIHIPPSGSARSLTYRSAVNDRLALMHAITQQLGAVIGDGAYDSHAKLLTGAFEELLAETRNLLREDLPR